MAYNTSSRDKNKAAFRDTAVKMKQENKIHNALSAGYFLPIAKDFSKTYSKTGTLPNLMLHNMNLNNILDKQYNSTQNKFISQVRDSLGQPENAEEINDQIQSSAKAQKDKDVFITGQSIANTTHNSLQNAVKKVVVGAAIAGIFLSHRQVAKKARANFRDDYNGRLPSISVTQTQQAAEGAKYAEVNDLDRNNAIFPHIIPSIALSKTTIKKTWITVLDSRTRHSHVLADGQTVLFNEAYTVMGQKLKYPGDSSLGATAGNIINCRCSSVKSIKRK